MKHDDGAVARKMLHILKHLFAGELAAVVVAHEVVHDDGEARAQHLRLCPAEQAVWRSEQRRVYQFVGLKHIVEIHLRAHLCALHVVHRVITHAVTTAQQLLKQFGIALHIFAHTEECGFHTVVVERVEHPGGDFGDRSVVESEIHGARLEMQTPHRFGEQHSIQQWRTLHQAIKIAFDTHHNYRKEDFSVDKKTIKGGSPKTPPFMVI